MKNRYEYPFNHIFLKNLFKEILQVRISNEHDHLDDISNILADSFLNEIRSGNLQDKIDHKEKIQKWLEETIRSEN